MPQPIRNLEAAFFLTNLPDSQYCGWDFRYVLVCPRNSLGSVKECELFFQGAHESELHAYERRLSNLDLASERSEDRQQFLAEWNSLRQNLGGRLAIVHWDEIMAELGRNGFDRASYLENLNSIEGTGSQLVKATRDRWDAAALERHVHL